MSSTKQAADRIIRVLENAGHKQAKVRKSQTVVSRGYALGYDEKKRVVSISYEEPEHAGRKYSVESVLGAYAADLRRETSYKIVLHDGQGKGCSITPAHLHIKV